MPETKQKASFMESQNVRRKYTTSDGVKVPGVTTVLGIMDKPALLSWACEMGALDMRERCLYFSHLDDCEQLIETIKPDKMAFRKVSKKAAEVGTLAHFMSECYVKGLDPDFTGYDGDLKAAEASFQKFVFWWESQGLTLIESEYVVVSDTYGVGGTIDVIAKTTTTRKLIDLKTSKGIYDEMIFQVAAYTKLYNDANPVSEEIQEVVICRIGKTESADFETRVITPAELDHGWDVFKKCNALYKALRN